MYYPLSAYCTTGKWYQLSELVSVMMIFASSTMILMCVIRRNYPLAYFRRTLGFIRQRIGRLFTGRRVSNLCLITKRGFPWSGRPLPTAARPTRQNCLDLLNALLERRGAVVCTFSNVNIELGCNHQSRWCLCQFKLMGRGLVNQWQELSFADRLPMVSLIRFD